MKKNDIINLYLNDEEYDYLKVNSMKFSISVSDYIRLLILNVSIDSNSFIKYKSNTNNLEEQNSLSDNSFSFRINDEEKKLLLDKSSALSLSLNNYIKFIVFNSHFSINVV